MQEVGITWIQVSAAVGILSVVLGIWTQLLARIAGTKDALAAHELDELQKRTNLEKEFLAFKAFVAESYVSNTHLSKFEERIMDELRDIKESLGKRRPTRS